MKRILVISAHPDDDILGCGGIMNKFGRSKEFKVVFIGEGSTCRYDNPNSEKAQKEIKIRNTYAIDALKLLNINNVSFYNLPCGRFDQIPLIEINKIIENEILDFKPDTVFTHSDCDSNQDHIKVYNSTIIATRPGGFVENLLSYEVLSSTEWGFNQSFTPNSFYALSKLDILKKCEALNFYLSEIKPFPFPRSKDGILSLGSYRGMQSGSNFAEAFKLIRSIN